MLYTLQFMLISNDHNKTVYSYHYVHKNVFQKESTKPSAANGVAACEPETCAAEPESHGLAMNFSQNMASGMSYLRRRFSSSDLSKELTERQVRASQPSGSCMIVVCQVKIIDWL